MVSQLIETHTDNALPAKTDSINLAEYATLATDSNLVLTDSTLVLSDSIVIDNTLVEDTLVHISWPVKQTEYFSQSERVPTDGKFMLGVSFLLLCIIVIIRIAYPKTITRTFQAGIKIAVANRLFRDKINYINRDTFLLNCVFVGSISVFLFYILPNSLYLQNSFYRFSFICIGTIAYLYLKSMMLHFIGTLSGKEEVTNEYLYHVHLYNRITGIMLFPIVSILTFPHIGNLNLVLIIASLAILFSFIALFIRTRKILIGSGVSVFYLILYLCTLEILPVLYIYKFFENLI